MKKPPEEEALASDMREALAQIYGVLYSIPAMAGLGPHWALAPEEAEGLSKATLQAVKSIPAVKRARIAKTLNRVLPWAGLAFTAYSVTMPRVMVSLAAQQQAAGKQQPGSAADGRAAYANKWEQLGVGDLA